jgi:hypothetical protein
MALTFTLAFNPGSWHVALVIEAVMPGPKFV